MNVLRLPKPGDELEARSDDELMLLASRGVRAAFEILVRRHARRLIGFLVHQLGDRHAAEETAQDVWLAAWDHRESYRAEGKLVVWLFTLARNRARNVRRAEARPALPAPGESTPLPSELDRLLDAERRARLARALGAVSPNLREALALRFGQDLSYDEIARVLDTNESTARSRVFHALRKLRRHLKGDR